MKYMADELKEKYFPEFKMTIEYTDDAKYLMDYYFEVLCVDLLIKCDLFKRDYIDALIPYAKELSLRDHPIGSNIPDYDVYIKPKFTTDTKFRQVILSVEIFPLFIKYEMSFLPILNGQSSSSIYKQGFNEMFFRLKISIMHEFLKYKLKEYADASVKQL